MGKKGKQRRKNGRTKAREAPDTLLTLISLFPQMEPDVLALLLEQVSGSLNEAIVAVLAFQDPTLSEPQPCLYEESKVDPEDEMLQDDLDLLESCFWETDEDSEFAAMKQVVMNLTLELLSMFPMLGLDTAFELLVACNADFEATVEIVLSSSMEEASLLDTSRPRSLRDIIREQQQEYAEMDPRYHSQQSSSKSSKASKSFNHHQMQISEPNTFAAPWKETSRTGLCSKLKMGTLMQMYPGIPFREVSMLFSKHNGSLDRCIRALRQTHGEPHQEPERQMAIRTTKATSGSAESHLLDDLPPTATLALVEELRREAQGRVEERQRVMTQAREAQATKNPAYGHILAERAHAIHLEGKKIQHKAMLACFRYHNPSFPTMPVDLHGLFVSEAMAIVKLLIRDYSILRSKQIHLISGRGSHSENQTSRIREAILQYASARAIQYTLPTDGSILLQL